MWREDGQGKKDTKTKKRNERKETNAIYKHW
jgi:hypothetical protein